MPELWQSQWLLSQQDARQRVFKMWCYDDKNIVASSKTGVRMNDIQRAATVKYQDRPKHRPRNSVGEGHARRLRRIAGEEPPLQLYDGAEAAADVAGLE